MTTPDSSDSRAGLPPHIRTLLEQMDAALAQIPPEHQERIVRELIEGANRLRAELLKATEIPDVFKQISDDVGPKS
jgi:hypothetical protein